MDYTINECSEDCLPFILEIFNDAILHSTALYDYKPRTMDMMRKWYEDKMKHDHPLLGAFDEKGELLGFATYGAFRVRPAYKYTMEHSVYVRGDQRGKGIGRILLRSLVQKAEEQNYHVLVGVIDAENKVSMKLHEQEGFVLTGIMKEVGYKFGRWLDVAFYQLILKTPDSPAEEK